jgi:hypothetical protein
MINSEYKYFNKYNKLIIFISEKNYNYDGIKDILLYFKNMLKITKGDMNYFINHILSNKNKCYLSINKYGDITYGEICKIQSHTDFYYDKIHYDNEIYNGMIKYLLINGTDEPTYNPKKLIYD